MMSDDESNNRRQQVDEPDLIQDTLPPPEFHWESELEAKLAGYGRE